MDCTYFRLQAPRRRLGVQVDSVRQASGKDVPRDQKI